MSAGGIDLSADQIASAMLRLHRQERDHDRRDEAFAAYHTCIVDLRKEERPESCWNSLLDSNVVSAILQILLDQQLCGFTKEELVAIATDPVRYVPTVLVSRLDKDRVLLLTHYFFL